MLDGVTAGRALFRYGEIDWLTPRCVLRMSRGGGFQRYNDRNPPFV